VCAAGPSESSVSKHSWPLAKQRPDQKEHKCTKYMITGSVMRAGIAVSQHFVAVALANLLFKRASHRTMVFTQTSSTGTYGIVEMSTVQ